MKQTVNMSRPSDNFDTLLDKVTSHLLKQPHWPSILQICDLIDQGDVPPTYVLNALKTKLFSQHQTTVMYALSVLEHMERNCGYRLLDELMARPFCDTLYEFAKTTPYDTAKQKLLQLLEAWTFAHRRAPQRQEIKDTMIRLRTEAFKFPSFQESDDDVTPSLPKMQDGDVCYGCRTAFESPQCRRLCGRCEKVFCTQCFQKKVTLPNVGSKKEYRVCDACYDEVTELNKLVAENQAAKRKSKINKQKETTTKLDIDQCLLICIKQNSLDGIDGCLERGANINKIISDGHTPLAHAVIMRDTKLVEHLLNKGVDVDVCKKGKGGKTPLSIAVGNGNFKMVKMLLDRGANAAIQTPFLDAIQSKNLDIVRYMKEMGARINWTYKSGLTPLMKALEVGDRAVIEYLTENGATINEDQQTLLLVKNVAEKNLKFIKSCVDSGADLDKIAPCGCTPLTKATTLEDFEMVKYIVGLGADVNCCGNDGKTALAIAASKNCFQIVKFLMESGADVSLAKTELDVYAEWNEDFDIFLKLYENKLSLEEFGSGDEEAQPEMN